MIYTSPLPDAHFLDTATLVVYLLAAASCLISSAGWHVLAGCAYRKWFEWGACVDCKCSRWNMMAVADHQTSEFPVRFIPRDEYQADNQGSSLRPSLPSCTTHSTAILRRSSRTLPSISHVALWVHTCRFKNGSTSGKTRSVDARV